MARRKPKVHDNHERWLVSYADFITLLFAFFVVMYASSQKDRAKAQQISDSVRQALEAGTFTSKAREVLGGTADQKSRDNGAVLGAGAPRAPQAPTDPNVARLLPAYNYLRRELQSEIAGGKLQVGLEARGLVISLRQAAFFPSGEDTIDSSMYPSLEKIAATIRQLPNPVRLEGHTDSVPIHTERFHSNWDLSAARAVAMLRLFSTNFNVPEQRFAVAGYAANVPVDSNETDNGRALNRRVDIVILNQAGLVSEPATKR